jgi:hypothetical protein
MDVLTVRTTAPKGDVGRTEHPEADWPNGGGTNSSETTTENSYVMRV